MKLKSLLNRQKRRIYLSKLRKILAKGFRKSAQSTPVFVFGSQRSGTTMLMNIFHLHPDTEVFDENKNNDVYLEHQVRSYDIVQSKIDSSKFKFVCFKPISDSHLIDEFSNNFKDAHLIWIYRDYRDFANSHLRKFKHSSNAIKLVCENKPGGGWFQEGVSDECGKTLREIYHREKLSEFDLECLAWWARNTLVFEKNILSLGNVSIINYEKLVTDPTNSFSNLFSFLGLDYKETLFRDVYKTSLAKNTYPEISPVVKKMCDDLQAKLDNISA